MKKKNKSRSLQIYKLPNHSWLPLDWVKPGSKHDKPEIVVRRTNFAVLTRDRVWNQQIKYNYSKEFCGENRPNDTWKPDALADWGYPTIEILAQQAADGNARAALMLAGLASAATFRLTKICETKPELVRELARVRPAWPVIKWKRERLSAKEEKMFTDIQLGADFLLELDAQSAKWKMDDAGEIARSLLGYIYRARKSANSNDSLFNYGVFGKLVKKLHDFDDESAKDWWIFAKEILLFSYPQPHSIEELNRLVTAKSKRKSPGRIKQAILDKLESRFLSFARNTFYQT
jgi:hypothetical protein